MSLQSGDRFTIEDLNAAYASKSENNNLGGTLTLSNTSSAQVLSVQDSINSLLDTVGTLNRFFFSFKKTQINVSQTVTTLPSFTITESPTNALNVAGAMVGTQNLCLLRQALGGLLIDSSGRVVFGRLTHDGTDYVLTLKRRVSNVEEEATIFGTVLLDFWYPVVTLGQGRLTYDFINEYFSDFPLQDIPDATSSNRGLVNTVDQTWSGIKSMDGVNAPSGSISVLESTQFQTEEMSAEVLISGVSTEELTGTSALANAQASIHEITGDLTTLGAMSALSNGTRIVIVNLADNAFDIIEEDTTRDGADRFNFGMTLAVGASVEVYYSATIARWVRV
jgi:hypothetical protein